MVFKQSFANFIGVYIYEKYARRIVSVEFLLFLNNVDMYFLILQLESSETLNIGDLQQLTLDITAVPRNAVKIGQIHTGQVGNRLC